MEREGGMGGNDKEKGGAGGRKGGREKGKHRIPLTKIHNQILQWHRPVLFLCLNVCTYSVIMPPLAIARAA